MDFFNQSEDPVHFLKDNISNLYTLPLNQFTDNLKIKDLIEYIRVNIPQYNSIVFNHVTDNSNILGCMNDQVCMSQEQSLKSLHLTEEVKIKTVYDFYDIISNLEFENRKEDINDAMKNFDEKTAYLDGIKELNELREELKIALSKVPYIVVLDNVNRNMLNDPKIIDNYENYLLNVFKIYDVLQQYEIINDAFMFLSKYYTFDVNQLQSMNNIVNEYKEEFLIYINSIKKDNNHLNSIVSKDEKQRLRLPELDILSDIQK
jgi:hypothetical protein